jgi:hypothetical protein
MRGRFCAAFATLRDTALVPPKLRLYMQSRSGVHRRTSNGTRALANEYDHHRRDDRRCPRRRCPARGDKRAVGYFDFSQRGLAGSFIAMLGADVGFSALSMLVGGRIGVVRLVGRSTNVILFGLQIGRDGDRSHDSSKRLDGFVPYLVRRQLGDLLYRL